MLASQAALCALTGSLEMLVFHTLSAGNTGQFSAPGTAAAVVGAAVVTGVAVALAGTAAVAGVAARTGAAVVGAGAVTGAAVTVVAVRGAVVTLLVDAAPHPSTD